MAKQLALFCLVASSNCTSVPAHAEDAIIAEAIRINGFVNCLMWTRDGVPISELADEGKLSQDTSDRALTDQLWNRTFPGGRIQVRQHNDGSQACSLSVWSVPSDDVLEAVNGSIRPDGPAPLDFRFIDSEVRDSIGTRRYQQKADHGISLLLSTPETVSEDAPSAVLTFFHEG